MYKLNESGASQDSPGVAVSSAPPARAAPAAQAQGTRISQVVVSGSQYEAFKFERQCRQSPVDRAPKFNDCLSQSC